MTDEDEPYTIGVGFIAQLTETPANVPKKRPIGFGVPKDAASTVRSKNDPKC